MSKPIVSNSFDEINHFNKFVGAVKRYASGLNADCKAWKEDGMFKAIVYSLHTTKMFMNPDNNIVKVIIYYGYKNTKTFCVTLDN